MENIRNPSKERKIQRKYQKKLRNPHEKGRIIIIEKKNISKDKDHGYIQ